MCLVHLLRNEHVVVEEQPDRKDVVWKRREGNILYLLFGRCSGKHDAKHTNMGILGRLSIKWKKSWYLEIPQMYKDLVWFMIRPDRRKIYECVSVWAWGCSEKP